MPIVRMKQVQIICWDLKKVTLHAIKSFRSHYGPGVDSASNRNEYQEYLMGVKSGRCVRLATLPPSCAVVTKSESLNFLEPFGSVQACNGTDLPFYITCSNKILKYYQG